MRRAKTRSRMGGAHPFRDKFSDWPFVLGLGLYDARACPDCGAVVCYVEHRRSHRDHHISHRDFEQRLADLERSQHLLNDTVRAIAQQMGLAVRSAESGDDDADSYDDRLTRKARLAAQGTVYYDERGDDAEQAIDQSR